MAIWNVKIVSKGVSKEVRKSVTSLGYFGKIEGQGEEKVTKERRQLFKIFSSLRLFFHVFFPSCRCLNVFVKDISITIEGRCVTVFSEEVKGAFSKYFTIPLFSLCTYNNSCVYLFSRT